MSHFTKVETQLKNLAILKRCIKELGLTLVEEKKEVRGYRGLHEEAEAVIETNSSIDIGIVQTQNGYSFIADWDMLAVRAGIEREEFIKALTVRYSYHTVKEEAKRYGYTVVEEQTTEQETVKLRLRRWTE